MASMRDIKRRKSSISEHTADYKGHEACFYRKAAESKGKSGTDESIF